MKHILLVCITFFTVSASAGLYLDPYLSYAISGSYEQGTFDEDASGLALGSRFGYDTLGLAFGLEYMTSAMEVDVTGTADLSHASLGLFVAYELPILFRVYGTYFFSDKMELENQSGTSDLEGTGLKLGFGYTGLPFVSINFEYYVATYDERDGASLTNDVDLTTMMIGISLPLSL